MSALETDHIPTAPITIVSGILSKRLVNCPTGNLAYLAGLVVWSEMCVPDCLQWLSQKISYWLWNTAELRLNEVLSVRMKSYRLLDACKMFWEALKQSNKLTTLTH